MRHVLSVLVSNEPGVLSRVTGLISRRGFNIESLSVGPTEDSALSRVTAIVQADTVAYDQITKQLHKLVCVYKINDLTGKGALESQVIFFKVRSSAQTRPHIVQIANNYQARIVDAGEQSVTLEVCGDEAKLAGLELLLMDYGLIEVIRSGRIAMARNE